MGRGVLSFVNRLDWGDGVGGDGVSSRRIKRSICGVLGLIDWEVDPMCLDFWSSGICCIFCLYKMNSVI